MHAHILVKSLPPKTTAMGFAIKSYYRDNAPISTNAGTINRSLPRGENNSDRARHLRIALERENLSYWIALTIIGLLSS